MSAGKPASSVINLTVITVAGQAGCLTLVIIFLALIAGLWLDARLDTRPLFTILLMVGSAPITFIAILWVVKRAIPRIKSEAELSSKPNQEEVNRGKIS
jgi:uncharacterized membrane protein